MADRQQTKSVVRIIIETTGATIYCPAWKNINCWSLFAILCLCCMSCSVFYRVACVLQCLCVICSGGEGGRRGRLLGSASDLECSAFLPVLDLCNLLLALWQSLLAHSITEIVTILSEQCFSAVLLIGHYFLPSTFMVACHLPLISQFASQQECLHTIVTPATVSHLIELISFHIDDITLISSALVLFSDFSAIEVIIGR